MVKQYSFKFKFKKVNSYIAFSCEIYVKDSFQKH